MTVFLAALSVYRQHRDLQPLYQRSCKAGRHHTDALVIVAHTLARIAWRLLNCSSRMSFRVNGLIIQCVPLKLQVNLASQQGNMA